jgi:hypothetical protein
VRSKTAGTFFSHALIALAAFLALAATMPTIARASDADNACMIITSRAKMGAGQDLVDPLIAPCNTSAAECVKTREYVTSIGFKYDGLTCNDPAAVNADDCALIKTFATMRWIEKRRDDVAKLIPSCNKSPARCAEAVKALGETGQKLDGLTCAGG